MAQASGELVDAAGLGEGEGECPGEELVAPVISRGGQLGSASRSTAMKRSTSGSKWRVIMRGPNSGELLTLATSAK